MIRRVVCVSAVALLVAAPAFGTAWASTVYDGQWSLTIATEKGACDSAYHFTVDINDGVVSHPNLVKFTGRVARNGSVRVSVSASGRTALGQGRLTRTAGTGHWTGRSGKAHCSGSWTAQRY